MCISAAYQSKKILKIAYWNIHGVQFKVIEDKLSDREFLNNIAKSDILGLAELHTDEEISIPGFKLIKQKFRAKTSKGPKIGGGIAILVKTYLQDIVQFVPNKNDDSIWIKVKQSHTDVLYKDIYIGTFYVSPINNHDKNKEDFFSVFNEEINSFDNKGTVIIQGDLNARIGKNIDFIMENKLEILGVENNGNQCERNSEDSTVNVRGNDLIDFCKTNDYLIVNGRKLGDLFGNYTSHQWNGSSVVDYLITSVKNFKNIYHF